MEETRLYNSEEIYRPLWERDSVFLEVTEGCSWNKCCFCYFTGKKFHVFSLEEIRRKAELLRLYVSGEKRLFLLGENPLVLDTVKLLSVFDIVHQSLPEIREISMYARVDDVLRKSLNELKLLRRSGLSHLYIGIESGNNKVLEFMQKGVTAEQAERACFLLRQSEIMYSFTIITGLGGKAYASVHVEDTVRLLNRTQPSRIWCMGLLVWKGTKLERMCREKKFEPLSGEAKLKETYEILKGLSSFDCIFTDTTIFGKYTVIGRIPEQKERMLLELARMLNDNLERI